MRVTGNSLHFLANFPPELHFASICVKYTLLNKIRVFSIPSVTHWSWWSVANLIYSTFFIGWLMKSLRLISLRCQSCRYLDPGYLTRLSHHFRYLTRLSIYPVQNNLAVGLRFVIALSLLFMIFHFTIIIVDTLV